MMFHSPQDKATRYKLQGLHKVVPSRSSLQSPAPAMSTESATSSEIPSEPTTSNSTPGPKKFEWSGVSELAAVVVLCATVGCWVWSIFLTTVIVHPKHWAFTAAFLATLPLSFVGGGYLGGRLFFRFHPAARVWLANYRQQQTNRAERRAATRARYYREQAERAAAAAAAVEHPAGAPSGEGGDAPASSNVRQRRAPATSSGN